MYGHVRLSDFGLCKVLDGPPQPYLTQYHRSASRLHFDEKKN